MNKLDAKAQKYTFIRYGGDDFRFKFWDAHKRKVIKSRDVAFDKKAIYKYRDAAQPISFGTT